MSHLPFSHRPPGLSRYGSAPGSLLASIADSLIGGGELHSASASAAASPAAADVIPDGMMGRFLAAGDPAAAALDPYRGGGGVIGHGLPQQCEISAGGLEGGDPRGGESPLIRHSSSPAGFFSNLMLEDGFSITRGIGQYTQPAANAVHPMGTRRLKSQLSFSRHETLSQISEIGIPDMGESIDGNSSDEMVRASYMSNDFPVGTWDESSSIAFSGPPRKRAKDNNGDISVSLSRIDSQFSLPKTSLEMDSIENLLHIQQDSTPFKIRAKRGCATHPRSIAERERRTKISEKLRKLQELVPNMDKQTSTADMLDLAVDHIKVLQSEIQILNQEQANCKCASKQEIS